MMKLGYQKLENYRTPNTKIKQTNEQRFWKKYQTQTLETLSHPVSALSTNNNPKQLLLYSHGRTVRIFDSQKREIVKQITNFNENVTSLCLRPDGNVMAIGFETGKIEVMDTKEKFRLRSFDNHHKKVNALQYIDNDLYSGGDDFMVRHYDVAVGEVVHSYQDAHTDYITCIKGLEDQHILTGGYDGYVRLFDFRVHRNAMMEFQHQEQIQDMTLATSKMNFLVCGGKKVSQWDIRKPTMLNVAQNHKKIVTTISLLSQNSRFATTSLDNYLKIYKTDSFQLTFQQKLESPINCGAVTQNNECMFLGIGGNKLVMKARNKGAIDEEDQEEVQLEDQIMKWLKTNEEKKFAYNDKYFYRGIYEKAVSFDIKYEQNQNKKVSTYDAYLKKFQYKQALMQSLAKKNMIIFLSLIDEYIQRGCLSRTIKSMTLPETDQLIQQLLPLVHNIKYHQTATMLLTMIVQQNPDIGQMECGADLCRQIDMEGRSVEGLNKLDGMLQFLERNFE